MPYHIKTPGKLEIANVYWKGDNTWTETYADRKQFANKSDADALVATTESRTIGDKTFTYKSQWWKDATVIDEG